MPALFTTLTPAALLRAALAYIGFVGVLFVLSVVMPGKRELGVRIPGGSQVEYTLSGFRIFLAAAALCGLGAGLGWLDLTFPARHFLPLLIVANLFAFAWTFILYAWGRKKGAGGDQNFAQSRKDAKKEGEKSVFASLRLCAKFFPGSFTRIVKDLFYGVDLNPSLFGVDLKLFSYRPSLMGLGILNASFAFVQIREHGQLSAPMALYQIFCFLYLANYFQFEYGMIYTWDIIAERFGWMLVWGDYVLVPFFYCIPGWYLVARTEPMPAWQIALLCAMYVTGFVLFRGSNEQKHRYKQDPGCRIWGKPAEALGGKLLVSGFWGIGRKLNYTGEILMYYAWTLTTGSQSIVPYLLPLWLTVLLPHRAFRDEQRCRAKYGALWDEYCRRAKFRMVPFIY